MFWSPTIRWLHPFMVSPTCGRLHTSLGSWINRTSILWPRVGEQFKSTDVPALYGEVYNPGNWRSGHVSLKSYAILFVSLEKRADRTQYTEHFEGPAVFVWSSQLTTSPERKKGKEILDALETGKPIELWMRRKGNDPAFTYLGRVIPISHEGAEPMLVKFRLLTPLTGELQSRLGFSAHNFNPQ